VTIFGQPNYRGYRFPPGIISHAVWLYHRFTLSLRDIDDLLAARNAIVSYESIGQWCVPVLSAHGQMHNLFRVGRHLLPAANYRILRGRAFVAWQEVTRIQ